MLPPGGKISFEAYNRGGKKYYNIVCWGKRIVSPEMWRKKILTQTKSKPKTQTKSVKVVLYEKRNSREPGALNLGNPGYLA